MGVCSFGNETKKNSIIILSDEDEKNKIFYPKNEFYYTIYSNHNKNSYDKISIFLTYNNTIHDENSLFKFKVYFKIQNKKEEYVLEGITEEKKGKDKIFYEKYFDIDFIFENEQIIKIICIQNNIEIQTCILSVGRLIGCKANSVKIPVKNNFGIIGELIIDGNKMSKNNMNKLSILEIIINKFLINNSVYFFYVISNYKDEILYKSNDFNFENDNKQFKSKIIIKSKNLCDNDKSKKININFYQRKNGNNSDNKLMNDIEMKNGTYFTINNIINNKKIDIIEKNINKIGELKINYSEENYDSLLEYIKFELQINTIFSFDYPNKNQIENKENNNELIEQILKQFSKILILYDFEQIFSIYTIENDNSINTERVQSLNGILHFYRNKIKNKEIMKEKKEKTNIGNLLNLILESKIKKEIEEGINKYYIQIIILNELNSDIEETQKIFDIYSDFPVSFILILNSKNEDEIYKFFKIYEYTETKRKIIQILNINNIGKINSIIREIGNQIENFYEKQKSSDFFLLSQNSN